MMEWAFSTIDSLLNHVLSLYFVYSPIYLLTTIVIAYFIWRVRRIEASFYRFLFPREVYQHPSTKVDFKVAVFNLVLAATGAVSTLFVAPHVTHKVLLMLNSLVGTSSQAEITLARGLLVAVLLFLTQDFCRFLNHYLHHKSSVLWPFHAVHHSAEVLSPITFMRAHPVYYAFQQFLISCIIGVVQALVLLAFVRQIELWVIFVGTLAFQIYILLGAHLRHSHIRVSYGRILEHVLISPAQHQVHHSSSPKHFDKNFGEIFAIWDWMFGTLYIADGDEELVFGIGDKDGRLIVQPHPTLRAALLLPFKDSARALRRGSVRRQQVGSEKAVADARKPECAE